MSLSLFHDTIAAISTPVGTSALATIRISGPDAFSIVACLLRDRYSFLVCRSATSQLCEIVVGDVVVDDVVIQVHRAPRSFTGEDLCEISSHGSPIIAQEILSLLITHGGRQAEPGEFSRRAFFNGKIGIEEAELISIKAAAMSVSQLRGSELALHGKYERLRLAYEGIVSLVAQIDAEIDFGESDEIQVADFAQRIESVEVELSTLIQSSSVRSANAGYFSVALTGPPNVGKSSIFNALLTFERSIVSEIPGTTRDYVEAFIDIEGFRVKLVDTAGMREAEERLELRGIALGIEASVHSDLSFRVTDPTDRAPTAPDSILLHNKIDLDGWSEGLCISATTGIGVPVFHEWLAETMRARESELNQISLSQSEREAISAILRGLGCVSLNLEPAMLSEELRLVAEDLAKLLGMNVSSDSLDYIFSRMCIGK